jgi:hypothetical protein
LTGEASALADESTNGAANNAAVPESSVRRFTSAIPNDLPNDLFLDIASSKFLPKILAQNSWS